MKAFPVILIAASLLFCPMLSLNAQSLPDVKVEDAAGRGVATSTFIDGKVPIMLTLWSTSCKPCIMELDAICELLPDLPDAGVKYRIIAVCTDNSRSVAKARAFAAGRGWDGIELYFDPNQSLTRAMNVSMIPHAFVFDVKGNAVYNHLGYVPGGEDELFDAVNGLLK